MTPYDMVKEFHEAFGLEINVPISTKLAYLREDLIQEEAMEITNEILASDEDDKPDVDKKKLTKELADLMYVTIGTAVTFGLPLEEVFAEVHKSNMSKLTADGKVLRREDGKVLKSDQYKEPELEKFFK